MKEENFDLSFEKVKGLVALTRMKKKIYLISTVRETSTFLKWIEKNNIENLK